MHEIEDMTDAFTNEKVHVAGRVLLTQLARILQ